MSTLRATTLQHGSSAVQNIVLDNQGRAIFGPDGPQGRAALYVNAQLNRVGVNNESPTVALDVDGAINATGNTTLGGTLTVTGNVSFNADIDADGEFLTIGGMQVTSNLTPTTGAGWELFRSSLGFAQMQAYDRSGAALLGGRINTANWRLGEDGESYFLGNFGIGTSSPEEILHVAAASEAVNSRDGVMLQSTSALAADTGLPLVFSADIGGGFSNYGIASIAGRKENSTSGNAAGYLQFATGSSGGAISEKMRINSNGYVGIGETSPSAGLDVKRDVNPVLAIDRGTANTANFNLQYNGTLTGQLSAANGDFQLSAAGASTPISFYANGSQRMRLDNNGRLLLRTGTTAASNLNGGFQNSLQVEGTGATTSSISITRNSNDDNPAYINFGKSRGTSLGSNVAVAQDDTLAQIDFNGSDGSGSFNPFASIRTQVDGAPGNGDSPGRLRFYTTSDGSSSPPSAGRWTIHSDGVLKSGAADSGYLSGAMKIDGTRKIIFGSGNAGAIGTLAQGSGNATVDTGISVNRGNAGGSAILLWNGNFSNGTSTVSALYFIKFYYDGNNTPALTLIHGDNNLSIGQSASNTMTLTPAGNYNWTMTMFFGD